MYYHVTHKDDRPILRPKRYGNAIVYRVYRDRFASVPNGSVTEATLGDYIDRQTAYSIDQGWKKAYVEGLTGRKK